MAKVVFTPTTANCASSASTLGRPALPSIWCAGELHRNSEHYDPIDRHTVDWMTASDTADIQRSQLGDYRT